MNSEAIVIGAGLAGAVLSRSLAEKGYHVSIFERRSHIAGNLYDCTENHILVQKYGPHTFHTNNDRVINFVTRFATFNEFHLKCETMIKGTPTPSPFNFKTIDQFYRKKEGELLKEKLLRKFPEGKATILELLNNQDSDIRSFAQFLYENDYSLYTSKQWGIKPEEVDPSVLKRVPVIFSYQDQYFHEKFEGLPDGGFTRFVANILNHPNIQVVTGEDALPLLTFKNDSILVSGVPKKLVIYTGETDKLFAYIYGHLPYRSLRFEYEKLPQKSYQNVSIVAYPTHEVGFTRITEYTKIPYQDSNETIIAREYPTPYTDNSEPYYPILTDKSKEMAEQYKNLAKQYKNLILVGRLAEFKYYNMDQVVLHALEVADKI